ncbi:MAG TPA: hypothetical protein VFE13_13080 [Caulobacteraceae bacterium]|jgi:hypothetical protein|nr:hypothetical protein [Caulobacteraceae bacterium]
MKLRNLLIGVAGLAAAAGVAGAASAHTYYHRYYHPYHAYYHPYRAPLRWQANHPLRVQVNHRLQHLNRSITEERREGDISAARAHRLHARVHDVRMQERQIAARRDSHIGYRGQVRLNREETNVREHIPG